MNEATYYLSTSELGIGEKGDLAGWRKRLFVATADITADAAEYFALPRDRTIIVGSRIVRSAPRRRDPGATDRVEPELHPVEPGWWIVAGPAARRPATSWSRWCISLPRVIISSPCSAIVDCLLRRDQKRDRWRSR